MVMVQHIAMGMIPTREQSNIPVIRYFFDPALECVFTIVTGFLDRAVRDIVKSDLSTFLREPCSWIRERLLSPPPQIHTSTTLAGASLMGRSCPTYRSEVKNIIHSWKLFHRRLDREEQEAFDRVMIKIQLHSDAGSYAALPNVVESMFLSAFVEYRKRMRELLLAEIHEVFKRNRLD